MSLAVISGTGLYDFACMEGQEELLVATPYGPATVYRCQLAGEEMYFLPRHGRDHGLAPHLINYRANICALAQLQVEEVLAFCSVGGMKPELGPGSLMMVEQFIDLTWGRDHTFALPGITAHLEMTHPYCPRLSQELVALSGRHDLGLQGGGVYVCTQGPRFETPAEIRAYAAWGGNVVGMTGVPEVSLAREAGLCYAALAVVANYAAGLAPCVDADEITAETHKQSRRLEQLLTLWVQSRQGKSSVRDCACQASALPVCAQW